MRGDVRDQAVLERTLGEYEIDTVFHLAAQTIVGVANRNPGLDARHEHPRHVGAARGGAAEPAHEGRDHRVERQGVRRPRRAPVRRGRGAAGRASVRREQVVRRPHREDVRRDLRRAGGGHALRELLRRRRPQLEPAHSRHDPLGAEERAAGDPLRRHADPRLFLRRGRRRRVHAARRGAARASRASRRGVQLLERTAGRRAHDREEDPRAA